MRVRRIVAAQIQVENPYETFVLLGSWIKDLFHPRILTTDINFGVKLTNDI